MNLAHASVDDLVNANPAAIAALRDGWSGLGGLTVDVFARVQLLDAVSWTGEAADAFRVRFAQIAPVLRETGEALGSAVAVLNDWAEAVAEARSEAAVALAHHDQGEAERRWWLNNHAMIEAVGGVPVPDPSIETMAEAERMAISACDRLEDRARGVEVRLRGIADQALGRFSVWSDIGHAVDGVAGGLGDAVEALVGIVWSLSPVRLVSDLEGVAEDLTQARESLAGVVERFGGDPGGLIADTATGMVGLDTLVSDPARWVGQLLPEALAGAGAGAVRRGAHAVEHLSSLPDIDAVVMERLAEQGLVRQEALVPGGHFVGRHGPQTTIAEQALRAGKGLTPDGLQRRRANASRFQSWTDMFDAIERGLEQHFETGDDIVYVKMDRDVGEGFLAGSTELRTTPWVELRFGADGLYTAFPRLKPPPSKP